MEEKRLTTPVMPAGCTRSTAKLPLPTESTEHITSLQERTSVRVITRPLCSTAFGPVRAVQSCRQGSIQPWCCLSVSLITNNSFVYIPNLDFQNAVRWSTTSLVRCWPGRTSRWPGSTYTTPCRTRPTHWLAGPLTLRSWIRNCSSRNFY